MSDSEVLKPRSITELREAKEARTADALLLKDEQIEIITRQNQTLLESINKAEEESSALQLEKLAIEDENRDLRKRNFESQTRACAAESQFQALKEESLSRDKQLQILTEQNGELLRLLEIEEAQNAQISSKYESCKEERDSLDAQFKVLTIKNKSFEDAANLASREGCLRSEEVKLLQSDREKLIKENANITMQTSLEVDSLRDQVRLAKEKQYKLLHKIQNLEEVKERAQDEVVTLKERIKVLDRMSIDVDSKLQTEIRNNSNHEEVQRKLTDELKRCQKINKDLTSKIQHAEQDRLETEAEARDSADQLREMAEKVFQLLERLKLAELGKTRSVEAMRSKEQESIALKKKIALLTKEVEREGKARLKIGFDAREHQEKIRALKKHNIQLGLRCKEETKLRLKEEQERNLANDKIHTLDSRIVFLAEKLKSNEDALKCSRIEIKKMEDQLSSWANQNQILHERIFSLEKKNESLMTDLNLKEKEVKSCKIDFESLQRHANSLKEEHQRTTKQISNEILDDNIVEDIDEQMDEGRLRFYVDNSLNNGLIVIKGKRAKDKEWLESRKCNHILKRSLKSVNVKETLVQRLAEIYGMYMTKEEEVVRIQNKLDAKDDLICSLQTKNFSLQKRLSQEEESKRKTLLNYIGSMKDRTYTSESKESFGNSNFNNNRLCRIKLHENCISDEEMHLIAAALRDIDNTVELNLKGNLLTDEGARSIASLFQSSTSLISIDLRKNNLSRHGINIIAESLEMVKQVRHVHVSPDGRIEALRSNQILDQNLGRPTTSVETVCVVDIRDNIPQGNTRRNDKVVTKQKGKVVQKMKRGSDTVNVLGKGSRRSRKRLIPQQDIKRSTRDVQKEHIDKEIPVQTSDSTNVDVKHEIEQRPLNRSGQPEMKFV